MYKLVRGIEMVWLVIGMVALGLTIHSLTRSDTQQTIFLAAITLICSLMFIARRKQRKQLKKEQQ